VQRRKFVAITLATTVLLSPFSVFGRQPRLTNYQNQVADKHIKDLENSEPTEDNQAKNLLEMKISTLKSVYKVGETIIVNISLKNISENFELHTVHGGCNTIGYGTKVSASHHHKVLYNRSQFMNRIICSGRVSFFLEPHGDPLMDRLNITKFFMLDSPGAYTIQMWTNASSHKSSKNIEYGIKSNSIKVQVISK
jgi:hypothetical protein